MMDFGGSTGGLWTMKGMVTFIGYNGNIMLFLSEEYLNDVI